MGTGSNVQARWTRRVNQGPTKAQMNSEVCRIPLSGLPDLCFKVHLLINQGPPIQQLFWLVFKPKRIQRLFDASAYLNDDICQYHLKPSSHVHPIQEHSFSTASLPVLNPRGRLFTKQRQLRAFPHDSLPLNLKFQRRQRRQQRR